MAKYWAEYDWIGIDQAARSASLCVIDESPSAADVAAAGATDEQAERLEGSWWLATQTLADPDGDGDWRIVALVDVEGSDRRGGVDLAILDVAPR